MRRKRSQEKRITVQCKTLRFMRGARKISQKEAARRCSVSEQAIGHYENGRMDISPMRLEQFLRVYGFTRFEYEEYVNGKPIPVLSVREDCVNILGRIDENKLRAVHAVLVSFVS